MAFPTIATPTNAKRVAAAIQSVYCRPSGELYQTLGAIRDCELIIDDYQQSDSLKKNKSIQSRSVTATCKMMQCSLVEIELLDTIISGTSAFLFKMADAAAIPTGGAAATEGWFLFSSSQIGVEADIDLSGTVEDNTFITLRFKGSIQDSAYDAAIKASIDDDEFEATGGSGTIKAIGTYTAAKDGGSPTPANIKSAGISSLTLADTGGSAQTLGPIDSPKILLSAGIVEQDSLKVVRQRSFNCDFEYMWKQTDAVNLLNLDDFTDAEIDVVLTMANGLVMTLTNKVGIGARLESRGDYEGTRSIVFTHTGAIRPSEIDGIFS